MKPRSIMYSITLFASLLLLSVCAPFGLISASASSHSRSHHHSIHSTTHQSPTHPSTIHKSSPSEILSAIYPSTPNSAPISNCQFQSYDFSSLSRVYFSTVNTTSGASYSFQLCRGLIWDPPQPQPNEASCIFLTSFASLCYVPDSTNEFTYGIGEWASAEYQLIDPSQPGLGVLLTLVGDKSCVDPVTGERTAWISNIQLQCATELGDMAVVQNPVNPCYHNLTIPTPLACSP